MALNLNPNGSIAPFDPEQIELWEIETADVRDGGHPTMAASMSSATTTRTFWVTWEHRFDFLAYMLGAVQVYTDGSGFKQISRLLPQTYPGINQMACVALESMKGDRSCGIDDTNGVPAYKKARCTFRYEIVPFDMLDDIEIVNESERYLQPLPSQSEVTYLSLPGGMMQYILNGSTARPNRIGIPFSIGMPQLQSVISYKWLRVPHEAWGPGTTLYKTVFGDPNDLTTEVPFVGTVNASDFLGRPMGTLLLLTPEEELVTDPLAGTQGGQTDPLCWNLTYRWLYKPNGHNYLYWADTQNSDNSGYHFVSRIGNTTFYTPDTLPDGISIFNTRDHQMLFEIS